jgi:hypothetical protein
MQPYTPALAQAEHRCQNAARLGCPLAIALADINRARALNAARTAQAEAEYAADPAGFMERLHHDRALSADAYYYPAS